MPGMKTNCWEWTGALDGNGRGQILARVNGEQKDSRAARVAWFLKHGKWPKNLACHHCDNEKCVRNDHLFDGTQAENIRDAMAKGRAVGFRLSARRVSELKRRGWVTLSHASFLFGIPYSTVYYWATHRDSYGLPVTRVGRAWFVGMKEAKRLAGGAS